MKLSPLFIVALTLFSAMVFQSCAGGGMGGKSGPGAHAHIGHVAKAWADTPGGVGFVVILEQELKIALQHAALAIKDTSDLNSIQMHTQHVRHAVDPTSEVGGPGKGYGVYKSAKGVEGHIKAAAASKDASKNVKLHATHVATSAANISEWADQILVISGRVIEAKSASVAELDAMEILLILQAMERGQNRRTWKKDEGGLMQVKQHLGFMMKGEGMKM